MCFKKIIYKYTMPLFTSLAILAGGVFSFPMNAVNAAPRNYHQEAEDRKLMTDETN